MPWTSTYWFKITWSILRELSSRDSDRAILLPPLDKRLKLDTLIVCHTWEPTISRRVNDIPVLHWILMSTVLVDKSESLDFCCCFKPLVVPVSWNSPEGNFPECSSEIYSNYIVHIIPYTCFEAAQGLLIPISSSRAWLFSGLYSLIFDCFLWCPLVLCIVSWILWAVLPWLWSIWIGSRPLHGILCPYLTVSV